MSVLLASIIGAGINAAASGIGSYFANKRRREAEEAYKEGIDKEISELDSEINSNYLDRAEARNAISKVTDANTETLRQLNTDAIRGGATDEAKVAMASKLNKSTAEVVGDLAVVGEQRKEALEREKRNLRRGLLDHEYDVNSDVTGIYNIAETIGRAGNTIASAWGIPETPEVKDYSGAFSKQNDWAESTMNAEDRKYARQYGYGNK